VRGTLLILAAALAFAGKCGADVISYLRFEEGSGTIAADQTGLMDGELIGIWDASEGWMTDVPTSVIPLTGEPNNYSIRFGGGSEYIDLSNANTLTLGSEFTIEFYMKPATDLIIAAMFGFESGSDLHFLTTASDGEAYMRGQFQDQVDGVFPAPMLTLGQWHHYALVMDPTEYTVYIDGQIQYKGGYPGGATGPYEFTGNVALGTRTIGGESGTWRGYIDEFRISDEALTPDQFLIAVPEPGTVFLCLSGVAALFWSWLKRRFG
jgi:hypothetical protein